VARDALGLADEQLRQSEDRFGAGVAGNLEVVQAQDAVATASDNFISAISAQSFARFTLARAVGGAERAIQTFLPGEDAKP
jgi:outer membrane protein TolC